jgi:hypothetical protein
MITGYNTDVKHLDIVFHVQTEDKGLDNPWIESLIYVGGQVLAAKRSCYSDMVEEGKGDDDISALMDQQHRTMIAAIVAGKFDGQLRARMQGEGAPPPVEGAEEPAAPPESLLEKARQDAGPSLDQVILEYLTNEMEQEQLVLLVEDGETIVAGKEASFLVRATSSRTGEAVPRADITVKMISTQARPQVLAKGVTDDGGELQLSIQLPEVDSGTAAIIISGVSPVGRAELKQLL